MYSSLGLLCCVFVIFHTPGHIPMSPVGPIGHIYETRAHTRFHVQPHQVILSRRVRPPSWTEHSHKDSCVRAVRSMRILIQTCALCVPVYIRIRTGGPYVRAICLHGCACKHAHTHAVEVTCMHTHMCHVLSATISQSATTWWTVSGAAISGAAISGGAVYSPWRWRPIIITCCFR